MSRKQGMCRVITNGTARAIFGQASRHEQWVNAQVIEQFETAFHYFKMPISVANGCP